MKALKLDDWQYIEKLEAEVERLKAHIKLLEGYVGNEMYRSDFQTAGHMRAEVERLKQELRFAESRAQALGEMFREAGRFDPSDLVAEVEHLKADKRQSIEINAKLSSRIDAALAKCKPMSEMGEAYRHDYGCSEGPLVVEVDDVVKALKGDMER